MVNLALGGFYRITYSQWKTNPRITSFILWPGIAGGNKVHLLNLSAIQLSTVDRLRLMQVLKRLILAAKTQTFTGRQLYSILKQSCPGAIRSCYRTMFRQYITNFALINYGLNSEEYFKSNPQFLNNNNKNLYDLANREFLIKSLNFMTGKKAEFGFAKTLPNPNQPLVTIRPAVPKFFTPTIQPVTKPIAPIINTQPVKPTGTIGTGPQPDKNNEEQNPEDDNNIF